MEKESTIIRHISECVDNLKPFIEQTVKREVEDRVRYWMHDRIAHEIERELFDQIAKAVKAHVRVVVKVETTT